MVAIPADVSEALQAADLSEFFTSYSPSHQREYLAWITEAKKPETRKRRIEKTITMLCEAQAKK